MAQEMGGINLLRQDIRKIEFTFYPVRRGNASSNRLTNKVKREGNMLLGKVRLWVRSTLNDTEVVTKIFVG